ncbi:hypothetical protein [[Clostridium] fimetarium]|uniref:Uncharacterized protein n=1 Tax=[Clostridium] fimetarium TaxID=99656 RepID=A0A1I0MH93_9FIRM|nr:hypothetical protein [[Clostridium] fimetarium]SEV87166.1 hypothetical protein SAMN05421659_101485 [[Clostridium] fimetarium]
MKDIYIYITPENWNKDKPEVTIFGNVISNNENYVEIKDDKGYTQIINIQKVFAIVYM